MSFFLPFLARPYGVLGCFLLSLMAGLPASEALAATRVDPGLLQRLKTDSKSASREVVLDLKGKADLSDLEMVPGETKAKTVARALKAFNAVAAAPLLAYLQSGEARDVSEVQPIWITNSLRVKASNATIEKLIAMNTVVSLYAEKSLPVEELGDLGMSWNFPRTWELKTAWGVQKLRAPEVWDLGGMGQGVVVAVIDSGANIAHADLAPSLWKNPGETGVDASGNHRETNSIDDDGNGFVDDVYGWNFEENNSDVSDHDGHGSQTAGIVAGVGTGGVQTGVAPGAKVMILRACCESDNEVFESHVWQAMEYALENGARVISMSMSVKHNANPTSDRWRQASEGMLAADVIHINSAGNRGSYGAPYNVGAPASNPPAWFHAGEVPGAMSSMIAIGATDEKDVLRPYSSTGPVTWQGIAGYDDYPFVLGDKNKPGLIKPEVCAPSGVPSLEMIGSGYTRSFGGTSSATPHIAGVAALVLSLKPELSVAQMTEALEMSAVPVGEGSFNDQCGAGRVDALAAVQYAKERF